MSESQSNEQLVLGRECGRCTVCCKVPKIDVPELKKLAGVLCEHCVEGGGCRIYANRPPVCKGWYCGWRRMRSLGDEWRPDRCGILIDIVGRGEGIPDGYPKAGLKFDIVGSPQVLAWAPLVSFIGAEIERGMAVFLGVPAPVGYERRKILLNDIMADAVTSHDRGLMIQRLVRAFELALSEARKERTAFH